MRQPPRTRAADHVPTDADPEFLALTPRQRSKIDRAFERAIRPAGSSSRRKKRKIDSEPASAGDGGGLMDMDDGEGEGGFMDAGGFVPDGDDGGGGFMPDDDDAGGGFMPEDSNDDDDQPKASTTTSTTRQEDTRLPFRSLPGVLSSLNLPSDEDVLGVFRASAAGWGEGGDEVIDLSVGLKDFRAVCAALMGPDEGGDEEEDDDRGLSSGDEDAYREEGKAGRDDDDSELSELSDDGEDEYRAPNTNKGRGKPSGSKAKRAKAKGKGDDLREKGRVKLNPRQKEIINDLWGMVKPEQDQNVRGGHVLGRDEVKRKVRELGEMWTEDEVSEANFSPMFNHRLL